MLALLAAAALLFERGPVVSDVTKDGAEIRWEPASAGALLLVDTGGSVAVEVVPVTAPDGTQRARITGLASDTRHHYRIRTPAGESEPGAFRTFPASASSPISFIATGDTRSNHIAHAKTVARVLSEAPDFIVSTGDLVGDGRDRSDWDFFFQAEGELLRSTPFFPAVGNHDAMGLLNETLINRWFGRGRYYQVDAGPAILLFIDTTLAYGGGSVQNAWITEHLEAARAAKAAGRASWIIAVHHHPAFSSAHHGSEIAVQRELVPLYEAAGVDLVLNGHDHVYERLEKNGITYIVTGGGGAPLYDFGKILPESKVHVRAHHFLKIAADTKTLEIAAVDLDGNLLDRHRLDGPQQRAVPTEPLVETRGRTIAATLATLAGAALVAWLYSRRLAASP